MSDWQVGDLAACVDTAPRPETAEIDKCRLLTLGRIYTVELVHPDRDGFWIAEISSLYAFYEDRFRKIRPDAHEECEAEFVTLLKRSKRKVSA
jgi:hypothetical protein